MSFFLPKNQEHNFLDTSLTANFLKEQLLKNAIQIQNREFLMAGPNQFSSLWTRDFCHSVPALIRIGKSQLAKDHLGLLLGFQNKKGLIPRIVDHIRPELRVSMGCAKHVLGLDLIPPPPRAPLRPYYNDEHGAKAIDSNLLVILGLLQLFELDQIHAPWVQQQSSAITSALQYYDKHTCEETGFLKQDGFSDWQDSIKRRGMSSYTNFLYLHILEKLSHFEKMGSPLHKTEFFSASQKCELIRGKMFDAFFDDKTGLFVSVKNAPFISLESNLMCLDFNLFQNRISPQDLWRNLRRSALFHTTHKGRPYFSCTHPEYPRKWHSFASRISGIWNYHDSNVWSWLLAYGGLMALRAGDFEFAHGTQKLLKDLLHENKDVCEVFQRDKHSENGLTPLRTCLYSSEKPFSWGAAYLIEFFSTLGKY